MSVIYSFGDCVLDSDRVTLHREGEEQSIEPQVFDVLIYLLRAGGRVVPKEELLDEIWGDRFVSESTLTTRIKSARRAVGDNGTEQSIIRTAHGKGYAFVAELLNDPTPSSPGQASPWSEVESNRRLPAAVHALIGRDEDVEALKTELATSRLTTLVGPAGVGKTALAYEAARELETVYEDGVVAVELVTVESESALHALATALDVHTQQGQHLDQAILEWLSLREILLLLDNCEHVIEPVSAIVGQILRTAPGVAVLATSREALAIAGEQLWPVEPLRVGTGDEGDVSTTDGRDPASAEQGSMPPAIALFVERATATDPRFTLTEANVEAVTEICRRLDGVPLAIELAASRAGSLDIDEIASRLDERFRLLKGVRRGADPRHRVLEDAVRWSYDLLEPPDQRLFARLSVFAGKFDLADAEAVCGIEDEIDVIDALVRLAERSMLTTRRPAVGPMRFEMLETMRDYGRSRLDDEDSVALHDRHASHYVRFATTVRRKLGTDQEGDVVRRADAALPSLRSVFRYSLQVGDVDTAFTLCSDLREYAMRTMRYEILGWADAALALGGAEHPLHATVTGVSAYRAWVRGEFDQSIRLANEAAAEERRQLSPPSGLVERVLGNVLYTQGADVRGREATQRQVEIAVESGDPSRMAHAYYMHSVAHSSASLLEEAVPLAQNAQRHADQTSSPTDRASALIAFGFAAHGDADAALDAFLSADRLAASVGNRWMSAFARTESAGILLGTGRVAEACEGLTDVINIWFRFGEWAQQWLTMSRCVLALSEIGEPELASQVVGAIEQHATVAPTPVMASLRDRMLQTTESLSETIGANRYDELRTAGSLRPVVDIVHETSATLAGAEAAPTD